MSLYYWMKIHELRPLSSLKILIRVDDWIEPWLVSSYWSRTMTQNLQKEKWSQLNKIFRGAKENQGSTSLTKLYQRTDIWNRSLFASILWMQSQWCFLTFRSLKTASQDLHFHWNQGSMDRQLLVLVRERLVLGRGSLTETEDDYCSRDVSTNDNRRKYFRISSNEIRFF